MATQTTNYHLSQPEPTDNFEDFLGSYNDNMEIIDQNMGGGGGGSSTFAGLTDVSLTNVQNGQVPKYNAQTQKWENANESGGGTSYTAGDGIDITSNVIKVDTAFSEAQTRANISSGDTFSTILGKIKKFFTDLKAVAFSGDYADLSNTPTIPTATSDLTNDSGFTATSWTQIQQSGTKIASINIDGNTTDVYAPTGGTPVSSDLDIDVIDTADATKTIALPHAGRYLIVGQQGYNCTNVISITGTYTTVIDESATAHQSGETSPRNVQVMIIDAEAGVSITFTITNSSWPASGGVVCELINTDTIGTPVISYTSDGTTTVNVSDLTSDTKFILLGSGAGRSAGNRSVSTTNISKIWDIKNTGNMVAMIGDVVGGGSGSISAYGFDGGMSAVFAIPYTTSGGGGGGGYETIEDADGTALTQRDTVQFGGYLKSSDDNVNQKTVVSDEPTEITWDNWQNKTSAEKLGTIWMIEDVPSAEGSVEADLLNPLWTNPNPTASFASQQVSLSSGDYDFLLIIWKISSGAPYLDNLVPKGENGILSYAYYAGGSVQRKRWVQYVSDTILSFGNADQNGTTNNDLCLPITIYGIKKKITVFFDALAESVSTLASKCMLSDGESVGSRVEANNLGTAVNVTPYNSASNKYTFPSDGYVRLYADTNGSSTYASMAMTLYGADESVYTTANALSIARAGGGQTLLIYVKKGMKAYFTKSGTASASAGFWALH